MAQEEAGDENLGSLNEENESKEITELPIEKESTPQKDEEDFTKMTDHNLDSEPSGVT